VVELPQWADGIIDVSEETLEAIILPSDFRMHQVTHKTTKLPSPTEIPLCLSPNRAVLLSDRNVSAFLSREGWRGKRNSGPGGGLAGLFGAI
jgi:hypothetical protein